MRWSSVAPVLNERSIEGDGRLPTRADVVAFLADVPEVASVTIESAGRDKWRLWAAWRTKTEEQR